MPSYKLMIMSNPVLDGLRAAAERKQLTMSDTLDLANIYAVVYEKFGDEVVET